MEINEYYGGAGIYNGNGGTVTVTNNTISGNTSSTSPGGGINNGYGTVTATNNWWGASTGPSGGVPDPVTDEIADGDGDGIGGSISFDPWYIDEEMTTLSDYIPPDTTLPIITLIGADPINLFVGDTYTELGATWTDAVDGTGSAIVGGDTVNTSILGTYIVTYNYNDTAGNAAVEVTRTVIVSSGKAINSNAPGKGSDAPGQQKPFNPNSQASENAGKKK